MIRNTASQYLMMAVYDANGNLLAGDAANITILVSKDGGTAVEIDAGSPTDVTDQPGIVKAALTQAETNAITLAFTGTSTTTGVTVEGRIIETVPNTPAVNVTQWSGYPVQQQIHDGYAWPEVEASDVQGVVDDILSATSAIETAVANVQTSADAAARPGDEMDLVNAPNGTAVAAIQSGLSTYAGADTSGTTELLTRVPDATAGETGGLAIVGSQMDLVDAPNATAVAAIATAVETEMPLATELHRIKSFLCNVRKITTATGAIEVYDDNGSTLLFTLTPSEAAGVVTLTPTEPA